MTILPSVLLKLNSSHRLWPLTLPRTIPALCILLFLLQTHLYLQLKYPLKMKKIKSALSCFETQKVYGPDGIPVVLKNCTSVPTAYPVELLRLCLSSNTFPSCWKFALIQHVQKKSDHSQYTNYRSIPLISCLAKVFENILNFKIEKYLSTHNLLSIISIISVRTALMVIFLLFLLILGHLLFGILVKALLLL